MAKKKKGLDIQTKVEVQLHWGGAPKSQKEAIARREINQLLRSICSELSSKIQDKVVSEYNLRATIPIKLKRKAKP